MENILYRKVGKRYVPAGRENYEIDMIPFGWHLIHSCSRSKSTRFNIDPDDARLLAAAEKIRLKLEKKLLDAMDLEPKTEEITPEARKLLDKFNALIKNKSGITTFWRKSVREIVDSAINELIEEAKNSE